MNGQTTYGELMVRAARGIHHGLVRARVDRFDDAAAARTEIEAFREVLRALGEHTWVLLERRRLPGLVATPTPDPRERGALDLADALHDLVGPRPVQVRKEPQADRSAWGDAARAVRAASDLVTTHSDAAGLARTPDFYGVLRDPAIRHAALAQVGDLTATTLSGSSDLALRALQAGVTRDHVRATVPDTAKLQALASDIAGNGEPLATSRLEGLRVARPEIRTDSLPLELADRLGRLRRAAWDEAHSSHPSVDNLKTFAVLGIAVHAHTLALAGHTPSTLRQSAPSQPRLVELVERGRTWREISETLFTWRSAQPGEPVVADDLRGVSRVLREVAPLTEERQPLDPVEQEHLVQAVRGAVSVVADVGRWNRTTVERMSSASQLYAPAAVLTGARVTDSPVLASAKLNRAQFQLEARDVDAVVRMYKRTSRTSNPALLGYEGLRLGVTPEHAFQHGPQESIGRDVG